MKFCESFQSETYFILICLSVFCIKTVYSNNPESNLESSNSRAACDNVYQTLQSNQTQRLDEEPVFGPPQLNFCQELLAHNTSGCNFTESSCGDLCPLLGHRLDRSGCVKSCECKTSGLFEGDIRYDADDIHTFYHIYLNYPIRAGTTLYPNWDVYVGNNSVKVPFMIGNSMDNKTALLIYQSMSIMEAVSCLRFIERTEEEDFLEFVKDKGCWSYVGRQGGKQLVSIGDGCEYRGIILHELMHALGFWHEQSRPDRDEYIEVVYKNIEPDRERNFLVREHAESYESPYDYQSIIHYGGFAFSKNKKPTLIDKRSNKPVRAQRERLSEQDIVQINRKYRCGDLQQL